MLIVHVFLVLIQGMWTNVFNIYGRVKIFLKIIIVMKWSTKEWTIMRWRQALHLNKLESPSPMDALCQVWLKLAQWFRILLMYYCYFLIISPKKRVDPSFEKNVNPLHPRMLCVKFGWDWPSGSGEEDENVKSLWQRQRTMDKFWSEKLAHLSLQLRWTKNET